MLKKTFTAYLMKSDNFQDLSSVIVPLSQNEAILFRRQDNQLELICGSYKKDTKSNKWRFGIFTFSKKENEQSREVASQTFNLAEDNHDAEKIAEKIIASVKFFSFHKDYSVLFQDDELIAALCQDIAQIAVSNRTSWDRKTITSIDDHAQVENNTLLKSGKKLLGPKL